LSKAVAAARRTGLAMKGMIPRLNALHANREYIVFALGDVSAHFPPRKYPAVKYIKIKPMMTAQTRLLVPKIFPSRREAPNSAAREVIPEMKTVR